MERKECLKKSLVVFINHILEILALFLAKIERSEDCLGLLCYLFQALGTIPSVGLVFAWGLLRSLRANFV
mgnify:CR=1 FL=1